MVAALIKRLNRIQWWLKFESEVIIISDIPTQRDPFNYLNIASTKMLKKSNVSTISTQRLFYCIKLPFLQAKNYKQMYQNAIRLNKSYQTYAQRIQNYFKAFHQYCSHIKQPSEQKVLFLYYFKRYIYDYTKIMGKITDYQISCFQAVRESSNDDGLSLALHQVLESAKKYTPFQKEIKEKKEVLTKEFTVIKSQFMVIQKKMKKPKYYYDRKQMRQEFQLLKAKISTNQKAQQSILSEIIAVDTNTTSFFSQIDTFRKQLIKNKYKCHKRLLDLALNSRQSLAQLFFYQYNCLNDYYQTIMNAMQQQDDQFSMMRADKTYRNMIFDASGCMGVILKNTEDFLNLLEGIENDLKTTEKNFSMINKRLKEDQDKGLSKLSFQYINKFFEIDQSPVHMILETVNAFQFCFRKLSEKEADVRSAAQQIQSIRKQIIKHKGITLSLLKVKMKNSGLQTVREIMTTQQIRNQCGVYQFMNSLDLKPVKGVIKNCLDRLLFTFSEILTFFSQKSASTRKFGMMDSMQLSYMQKQVMLTTKKKRPVKDQLWLWDDYKKRVDTQFALSKQLFNEINANYNFYKDDGDVDLDLQKYQCYCQQVQESGQLCLSKKSLKFTPKTNQKQLTIPLGDIQQVKRKKTVIKDSIYIKTKIGELVFRQFQNTQQVQTTLKESIQSGGAPKTLVQRRPKIQLTDGEKSRMESTARKEQMEKLRPAITPQFQQVQAMTFANITIDQFYDLILSDKKFTLTGKEHDSFLVYAMKKLNNKDFKITKFQPPGPKYYTLDQTTTFENGPLVSQCTYDYKHLLDMPFMPSECGNHQIRKIYWVSDKQLDYTVRAQTSGVPLSDNFYVELIYKIKEENQNTVMKVYAQVKFLKSFALKGTVESGSWKEIREGTKGTLAEMEKGVKLYKSLLSGETIEPQEEETTESGQEKEMARLKQRNMYLIIVVVVILLLNIIMKVFL